MAQLCETVTATTAAPPPTTVAPPTTRASATPPAPTTTAASVTPTAGPHALNDQAWGLMQRGDYAGALPPLQQSVQALQDPADPATAYVRYNLGYTLMQLGRCDEAMQYLQEAKRLEPGRHEVDDALKQARDCA